MGSLSMMLASSTRPKREEEDQKTNENGKQANRMENKKTNKKQENRERNKKNFNRMTFFRTKWAFKSSPIRIKKPLRI
jgi:hypothetical protein